MQIPDAIIIFSGGVLSYEEDGQTCWRSTTYDEGDAFGTLGGRDRVEAAALLAKQYPDATLVTTCKRMDGVLPTLASTYADELHSLGIPDERILKEEVSVNTGTSVQQVLKMAQERGWKNLLLLSSGFQIPRVEAFYEEMRSDIKATTISSESVLQHDPAFVEHFERVKETPAYQTRLAAEARGIEAIRSGTYRPAPIEDKQERSV